MLGKNYLKIGDVYIPNPISFSESYTNIENVGNAESGRELVAVTRLLKRSWSLSFNCSSFWLDNLKELCAEPSTTLTFRNEEIDVRARLTGATLAENSVYSPGTEGYYTVEMAITEI